jgi:hypothetical protein
MLHRARTIEPSDGMVAPVTAPGTNHAHTGAPSDTVTMSSTTDTANTAARGSSTRRWPSRSASRADCGATKA